MKTISFFLICFLAVCCNKIQLGNSAQTIVNINAQLTKKVKQQIVHIEQDNGINVNTPTYLKDGILKIKSLSNLYSFSYETNGNYVSNSPFALQPDTLYTVKFINLDSTYTCNFTMPQPITISTVTAVSNAQFQDIYIDVVTTTSKQFKIDFFVGEIDTISNDTSWHNVVTEKMIYDATVNSNIKIVSQGDEILLNKVHLIKIKLMSLNQTTANYLQLNYNYRKNLSTTNQFINPPKGNFLNAFGLVYGTCVTEIIKEI